MVVDFCGFGFGVETVCRRELYKGVTGRRQVFVGGDFLWRQPLLLRSMFVVTSSCFVLFGWLRWLGCLEGAGPIVLSLFLLIG